jgi:sulfatase maturation enzyme AslB (radical SAM superfamily)
MIPTFIELNPTELCNLKCNFCPRSEDYPNSNLHMTLDTVNMVLDHIKELIQYKNKNNIPGTGITISYTGRGEPVLQKNFRECIERIIEFRDEHSPEVNILVNTNGYKFDKHLDLYKRIDQVNFNVYYNYDFKEYLEFKKKYHCRNINVVRRKEGEESEPVNYNARSGAILNDLTMLIAREKNYGFCNKPFVNLFIDWNGDYILCCNDWVVMEPLGNVQKTSIVDFYYNNKRLQMYKRMLLDEQRIMAPCSSCNHFARGFSREQVF